MEKLNWIYNLREEVTAFLNSLQKESKPGFFCYSLKGDLYDEKTNWGLGNTVFAIKIYYTLNLIDSLPTEERSNLANFVRSFQNKSGLFFDPLIYRKSIFINIAISIQNLDFNNFFGNQTKIAETRQSISALNLLNKNPNIECTKFPQTEGEIVEYLNRLKWSKPWGAGSHFSHLLFFLNNSSLENKDALIDFTISWINKLQNSQDGCWYTGSPSIQQKINGAMKIITGLKAVSKINFKYPEQLIDLCLIAKNDSHACDNFNIVYVLKYANILTHGEYEYAKIKDFCHNRLGLYKQYYFPKLGGFSFHQNKANDIYYGAKITKGLNEPDIHGTVMFLWGISIIAQILKINDKLKFKEFKT